jgi:metal-responsive CopG/Arc/MetJ family transcriptional regulator
MKTAISIPDDLNRNIDAFLKSTRMSRSVFFQKAAAKFLDQVSARTIKANLDRVYADIDDQDSTFRKGALSHLKDVIGKEQW